MNKYVSLIRDAVSSGIKLASTQKEINQYWVGVVSMGRLINKKCDEIDTIIRIDLCSKIEQLIELNQPAAKKIMCKEKYDELFNKYLEILNS